MHSLRLLLVLLATLVLGHADLLEVKPQRSAIVRDAATTEANELTRLDAGTRVPKIGDVPRYYSLRLPDGRTGWSAKANFTLLPDAAPSAPAAPLTKESLLARTDLLQIIVLDVEKGDATLILCPSENGQRDLILIDCGERNDGVRIRDELIALGFTPALKPITRFIATHYDGDHIGSIADIVPWTQVVYDHGDNQVKSYYKAAVSQPGVDRRTMTLNYDETFSGGVRIECVATNQATDFEPSKAPYKGDGDNPNSIATVITLGDFQYFTAGDLTFEPEKSLALGIRNVDVYHVNHHGSSATSSELSFVKKLDPEVSVVSNGTEYGHPTLIVAQRLVEEVGSQHFQTNISSDPRAYQPPNKFIGDITLHGKKQTEDAEGATGSIRIVVDPSAGKYYVIMPHLPLAEGTFPILSESP